MKELEGFTKESSVKGMAQSNQINLDGIAYIKKELTKIGFNCYTKSGEINARRKLTVSELTEKSKQDIRNTELGTGNEQFLFWEEDVKKGISIQMRVTNSKSKLSAFTNYNLTKSFVDDALKKGWDEPTWRHEILNYLDRTNTYLLVMNKNTNWFILLRYGDIPFSACKLDARGKNKKRLNRLNIHIDGLEKQYKHFLHLEPTLKSILKIN